MPTERYFAFPHFYYLPISLRTLYTMVLLVMGIGYMFALILIVGAHAGLDGQRGLSVHDIQIAYSGDPASSRLETALRGAMKSMLPDEERATLVGWARRKAPLSDYDQDIKAIVEKRCVACHNGANPHIPPLTTYDDIKPLVQVDGGMSIGTLVRVSHIHLFGLTFIFAFTGIIFCHSYFRSQRLKTAIIVVPFISILLDIASWWLTKLTTPYFAYVVVGGGALMAVSFAIQWCVSLYQMWFYKPQDALKPP